MRISRVTSRPSAPSTFLTSRFLPFSQAQQQPGIGTLEHVSGLAFDSAVEDTFDGNTVLQCLQKLRLVRPCREPDSR